MSADTKFSQSYFWLNSWVLGNVIQMGTQSFCDHFADLCSGPNKCHCEHIVEAARSGVVNIVGASDHHLTSPETELSLLEAARCSFDELQADFFNFLLRRNAEVWTTGSEHREQLWKIDLDEPKYTNSLLHDAAEHILEQKSKYDTWIESENPDVAANAMLILCIRINRMLQEQLQPLFERTKTQCGERENFSSSRYGSRADSDAPKCPKCGKPMRKRMQKKGPKQGREFWGCSDYPKCDGVRHVK